MQPRKNGNKNQQYQKGTCPTKMSGSIAMITHTDKRIQNLERWQAGTANTLEFLSLWSWDHLGEHLSVLTANFTLVFPAATATGCPNPPNNQFLSWTHEFLFTYILLGKRRKCWAHLETSTLYRFLPTWGNTQSCWGTAAPWPPQPAQGSSSCRANPTALMPFHHLPPSRSQSPGLAQTTGLNLSVLPSTLNSLSSYSGNT